MNPVADPSEVQRMPTGQLARLMAAGELSAADVVEEFIGRIEDRNPAINAVVQPRFDAARQEARRADEARHSGAPLAPLHGVPITIKDCFAVAGLQTTLGIPGFSEGPDREDSPIVTRLKAAGAIVLGKTNVPQGMLMHECENPLFGRTLHPADDGRSPGGSSGGEAAAVATGMSCFGLASDLGGSTRQPAHCCGLVGFKPTSGRLTIRGSQRAMPGLRSLVIQPGPIARTVEDANLALRVMLDGSACPKQPDERPELWPDYQRVDLDGLRVAYWADNGVARPAAAVSRAIERAAQQLAEQGAQVSRVVPPDTNEMLRIYLGLVSADGLRCLGRLLRGKPTVFQLRRQVLLGRIPATIRGVLSSLLNLSGQGALGKLLGWTGPRSADSYWQLTQDADRYRASFWQQVDACFGGDPVDAVLTPPHSLPALRHGSGLHLLLEASHCYLANLLDAPAGVVPADTVSAEDEKEELGQMNGRWAIEQRLRRQNATGSSELPIGVQVMSRPWRDDVALAVMAALEH